MKKFLQSWLINTLAVLVAVYLVKGIHYQKPMDLAVASVTDLYYPGDVYEDRGLASVLLGNGDGSFQIQSSTGVDRGYGISRPTPAAVAVAVADFNGDGHQDFVVGTRNFSFETGDTVQEVAMLLGDG